MNVGLAGGQIADIEALATKLLVGAQPKLIVIAVGMNDTHDDRPTPPMPFATTYRRLIAEAKATGAVVVLANIGPASSTKFESARVFDQSKIVARNLEFASCGAVYTPAYIGGQEIGAGEGRLPTGMIVFWLWLF